MNKRRALNWGVGLGGALSLLWLSGVSPRRAEAATYFVAPPPTGNDASPGTQLLPFASIARAQTAAVAGDTVYFRGGTYAYTDASTFDSAGIAVNLSKSGTANNRINYWAFDNEVPVFDFAGIKAPVRVKGFNVTGSWLHLRGLEIRGVPQNTTANHESWGIYDDGGGNNIFERLDLHHNMGPGFFLNQGGNNLILNCDSHHNYDPSSSTGPGTNADGFGCHVGAGQTGNVFRGCRAWWNSDDGWDFIQAQVPVTVESSWAWYNGYFPDSTTVSSGGDGNGFKAGGYGVPASNVPATPPVHIVRFCVAFLNRASGFNANHHPVADLWYDNSAFNNNASNFNMMGLLASGVATGVGILRNNVAYGGAATINPSTNDAFNSWTLPVTVSEADFQSLSVAGLDGPRKADGSLPDAPFMKLRAGSDLIDKGTIVGLPAGLAFLGAAPDLGAFELAPAGTGAGGGTIGSGGGSAAGGRSGGGGFGGATGDAAPGSGGGTASGAGGTSASGGAGEPTGVGTGGSLGSASGGSSGDIPSSGGRSGSGGSGGTVPTSSGGAGPNLTASPGSSGCSCSADAGTSGGSGGVGGVGFMALLLLGVRARGRRQAEPADAAAEIGEPPVGSLLRDTPSVEDPRVYGPPPPESRGLLSR